MRSSFHAGFISGAALFAGAVILYILGLSPFWKWRFAGAWIPPVSIGAGVWLGRMGNRSRPYPFGQAFQNGLLTTFFMASTKAMLLYFFILLKPDVVALHLAEVERDAALVLSGPLSSALPAGEEDFLQQMRLEATPFNLSLADFQGNLISGLMLSLIFGLIFRHKGNSTVLNDHA